MVVVVVVVVGCGGQYPGEKEITFPPFTCLEADGDPRVERNAKGEVVVFPLKVRLAPPLPPCSPCPLALSFPTPPPPYAPALPARPGPAHLACVGGGGQASVNPKAETVEELQGRRKHLHMGMLRLAREDLNLTLTAAFDTFSVHLPSPFPHATVWYPLHRLC